MFIVEKTTRIIQDYFAYGVRPNEDGESECIDLFYEEGGEEKKYICITKEAIPALIAALIDFE